MHSRAVCYVATEGYLFETVLSSIQARQMSPSSAEVIVVFVHDGTSAEGRVFEKVCHDHGVHFQHLPRARLGGLHPTFGRLFLDSVLPDEVEHIIYLDGDTQIVQDIEGLVNHDFPVGTLLASRDPMVLVHHVDPRLGPKIEEWWDESGMPQSVRDDYVNAGMYGIHREDVEPLRKAAVALTSERPRLRFADQDAINLIFGGRIEHVSMTWNFPGFLLGSGLEDVVRPTIVHFMSNPRPWNAALPPWGASYHVPYVEIVDRYPELSSYWHRFGLQKLVRYQLQQTWKGLTEGRSWRSREAAAELQRLESGLIGL